MTSKQITATIKMPFHTDVTDLKGQIYTEEAITSIVNNFCKPIPITNSISGVFAIVGYAINVKVSETQNIPGAIVLEFDCVFNRGGTDEVVESFKEDTNRVITNSTAMGINFEGFSLL